MQFSINPFSNSILQNLHKLLKETTTVNLAVILSQGTHMGIEQNTLEIE